MNKILKKFKDLSKQFFGTGLTAEIFKNMGKLSSGLGIAKIIGFLSMPVITRIYTPEDFGVLSVFTSAVTLIVPISAFLYPIAIPLPKTNAIALNLAFLSSMLIFSITALLTVTLLLFGEDVFQFFNMAQLHKYWYILVLGVFIASFYDMLAHWATRVKAFSEVAKTKVWQALISAIVKIGMGVIGLKPVGLLVGDVLQRGGGVISLLKAFKSDIRINAKFISISRLSFLAKYYIDLPKFRLPSQFLLKLSAQAPILFFAFQFGKEETGQLGLALSVMAIPITLLANSTGKAYYAEIAKLGPNEKMSIRNLTYTVVKKMLYMGILPTLVLLFFSPNLFRIIFGSEWYLAGIYTSILSIYMLLSFVTNPLMSVLNVFNNQLKYLEINVVRILFLALIFYLSFYFELSSIKTLIVYAVFLILHLVYSGFQIYKQIR